MITNHHLKVLQKIVNGLSNSSLTWVVTGSLGMALQGVPIGVNDIDIQTDKEGAYEIARYFANYVVKPVHYSESERIRSHFGRLEIDGVEVEIMGDLQKRLDEQSWEDPVEIERYTRWTEIDGIRIPVLSLDYEYQAYLKLGRSEKAKMLQNWLKINASQ